MVMGINRRRVLGLLGGVSVFAGCTGENPAADGSITVDSHREATIERHSFRSLSFRLEDGSPYGNALAGASPVVRAGDHHSVTDSYNAFQCTETVKRGVRSLLRETVPEGSTRTVLFDETTPDLIYIWLDDVSLNELVLRAGYGYVPDDHSFTARAAFEDVQARARSNDRGFWNCRDETGGSRFEDADGSDRDGSSGYTGDYDCDDFSSQAAAQDVHEESGGAHGLDGDGDGAACEELP